MTTVAERILVECGVGKNAAMELIAMIREDRLYAAWEFFQTIQPSRLKRTIMIQKAVSKYRGYKKDELDDTSILVERCLEYLKG